MNLSAAHEPSLNRSSLKLVRSFHSCNLQPCARLGSLISIRASKKKQCKGEPTCPSVKEKRTERKSGPVVRVSRTGRLQTQVFGLTVPLRWRTDELSLQVLRVFKPEGSNSVSAIMASGQHGQRLFLWMNCASGQG